MLLLLILLCGYHPSINNNTFFSHSTRKVFQIPLISSPKINLAFVLHFPVLSCSVVSNSLQPHGLYSLPGSSIHGIIQAKYWRKLPCPPLGDLPNLGIKPWSPTLQMYSLLSEPPGKPLFSSPSLSQIRFLWPHVDCCNYSPSQLPASNILRSDYTTSLLKTFGSSLHPWYNAKVPS